MSFILTSIAAITALYGLKKGGDAYSDNKKAHSIGSQAQDLFKNAEADLKLAREETRATMEKLGERKLVVWDEQIGRFVSLFERLRNVELEGQPHVDGLDVAPPSREELAEMKEVSIKAGEIVMGGVQALGAGALVGLASYGGAMTFATASTGTTIAALSGAAAKSATLAWFGGGSLASGGLGMAGGMAVLGGLVAGPVLAVGGLVMSAKAKVNLAEARKNLAKAKRAAAQMTTATSLVRGIERVVKSFDRVIEDLASRMDTVLDQLEGVIAEAGTDYRAFDDRQARTVYTAVEFAHMMKLLLETPLLTEDGALDKSSSEVLASGRRLLEQSGKALSAAA